MFTQNVRRAVVTFLQLDKTQKQIQKAVNDFIKGEFKKEVVDSLVETYTFPEAIWKKAGDIGLIGLNFPEKYSGQGMGMFENVLVAENLCRGDSSVGSCLSMTGYGAQLILRFGSGAQKAAWLPKVAEGDVLSSMALTEPGLGNDLELITTSAVKQGDQWVINGTKTFVMNAGPLAGFYLVLCRTNLEATSPAKAFSTILVDAGHEGITLANVGSRLGHRLMSVSDVIFDKVSVPVDNLVGKENQGIAQVAACLNENRILAAARALGIALGAFDRTLAHVKQREQFGRKLVDFQITRQKLAEMATKIEAARLLTYQAAWQFENNRRTSEKSVAMAKLHACRTAVEVTDEAIQLLGGYGYMLEYEVERYFRDAKMVDIFDGTPIVHKNRIAAELVKGKRI
ncbi:MAG: acyl-CoA dehydrogenase [Desulfobacteraceae bacterium]|nr:acyl-CoA dehydrogenase [Desulfobacteraceae bacterium]